MTRFAYALLWWLATPFAFVRLAWRARRQPGYLERWGERLGFYAPADKVPRIWIHAVSLGETRAAAPLVEALTARYPRHRILFTHMTPTGRQAGRELFGDRVERAWLPYDHGFAVRRFVAHFAPAIGIVMETEIWPRLLEECARQAVPTVLANARLSERSARRYARWPRITRWALGNVAGIAAQTREDAARFEALGASAPGSNLRSGSCRSIGDRERQSGSPPTQLWQPFAARSTGPRDAREPPRERDAELRGGAIRRGHRGPGSGRAVGSVGRRGRRRAPANMAPGVAFRRKFPR